jgi:hypothetical protein
VPPSLRRRCRRGWPTGLGVMKVPREAGTPPGPKPHHGGPRAHGGHPRHHWNDARLETWFPGASWDPWRAVLRAAFALQMTPAEVEFFRTIAGRDPPRRRVRELWVAAGRRSGKDSVASLVAAYVAVTFNQNAKLRPGERAVVLCLALRPRPGEDCPELHSLLLRRDAGAESRRPARVQ